MDSVMIKKINVHHIIEGVHTDECEAIESWDTEWNPDIVKNVFGDKGMWQCPYCNCVSIDKKMISLEELKECYL